MIVCQVCHAGDELEGLQWSIEFKVSQSVQGFLNPIFVSSHMYPENPEGTQVIVGSMNMGYISDTVRNRTHNLIRHKRKPMPLGHSDGLENDSVKSMVTVSDSWINAVQSFLNQIQILGKQNNRSKEHESYSNNRRKYRQGRHFLFFAPGGTLPHYATGFSFAPRSP